MNRDKIIIKNAHTNNLKNIDIEIPKHKLVVFTGISGSGKSSLLFDTIYTEAQRQLVETFSTFARTRMPKLSRPDVDDILNLSTAIVIDQKRMGNNLRSTVGTATEINTYLRLLFSRIGKPFVGPSFFFSFNHPEGMCPHCNGLGKQIKIDIDLFLDKEKSIRNGAITHPHYKVGSFLWKELDSLGVVDAEKPLKDFSESELNVLLYSEPFLIKNSKEKLTYNRNFEGIARKLEKAVTTRADDETAEEDKNAYTKYYTYQPCKQCGGTRLNERARNVKINGLTIDEVCSLELVDVLPFLLDITDEISKPILRKAQFLLQQLIEIGVGYLSLDRAVGTLSGGESQRVKMSKQMDCNLVDMLYVLDEPSIGLHPRDTENLLNILFRLKEKGNSVFVVEHDPDVIRAAEWIVDMGPNAGKFGGNVVYNGEPDGLATTESLTGEYLLKKEKPTYRRKPITSFFEIKNATANNLKNVSVKIPKGVLTCVTGVAGSGKSSLIHECFAKQHPEAIVIDQSAIGKSSRANAATFIGVFDFIRKEFASATNSDASLFSFNSKGACPKCNGQGVLTFELHFLDSVKTICDECEGKRYHSDVLELKFQDKNIAEVLDMTVNQAYGFFKSSKIKKHLHLLQKVGLGYLKLGQSLSTLSGGESQRLKIATELNKESNIYIMDEPTTGLHMSDIDNFYKIVKSLVANNNTVVIIEHNLDIIKYADWIIDMGPEGGKKGGELIFQGLPEDIINCKQSVTGKYLEKMI
ncbi:MAG: daunorubicin resistance protein DrrC [Bacteroidetes bacterium GWC2_33_15]|nr:MAG: daunorubicin resistance protein DrrC [Bacteroidetes bacterium GWA2_33_15]OFX50599.1 MAG: daunorubicin resistance protein DrrC [Bacteroidetes bacterium GWC2_33_15]OFX64136.1 MAG: daunorubicin resistance protein DrrC [Bacteroidetes bacterium GWB2_32_14]OFX69748.1 MAG: daunorubicin resistance protein DrrC [Bacteroidetes bacterium GWD2_33_33]HAN19785.1 daunorubicin resistance protein DrrC [Bacteroidales bacterium]